MSSNTAGERRWATARKGGMTVLGKVAVPKPLNLPSQRLENHGLDPNVAIVPKGTLSWGSRGSSSGSDARNSSSLSSNADGGMTSPSHRPSSGGSGTRPSTAGSDRTNEPLSSAWTSNSRPSSAAGTLPSNQTPLSSRPRSAETRPNSSQLSRFAEPAVKNSVPWGSGVPAERLGVKEDGFSLNSGDFPTLGSDREESVKNIQIEDHSRPNSASETYVPPDKDTHSHSDVQGGSFGTWRMEDSQGADEAKHPSIGKWPGEPQHYLHANVPPQFDPWCGPPVNAPDGHWDRGHPRGPQFRPPVGPNGFPMEPFPYYPPQLPPPHLAGPQPVHPTGAAPRGHHPKNGDLYRPHIHDIHPRPGMAFRPGFYPGPRGPMPFEGYYGPPRAYRNEQDFPFMGMGPGRPIYDGYPGPGGPNLGNTHGRAGGYSPSGKIVPEKVDADHLEDSHTGKRVLLNHERWDQKMAGDNWEDKSEPNMLHTRKDYPPAMASLNNEMAISEHAKDGAFVNRIALIENVGTSSERRGHSAENVKEKSFKVLGKVKAVNDSWSNKSEEVTSLPSETIQVPLASGTDSLIPAGPKESALMQKIEGLNAKIRVSEEQRSGSQVEDLKIGVYIGEVSSNASSKKAPLSGDIPAHESVQPMGAVTRRSYHDEHGRDNYRGKGKFNSQDDGRRKKAPPTGFYGAVVTSNTESVTANNPQGYIVAEAFENSQINPSGKSEGDAAGSHDDSTNEQRAKMRELARQRALQRQKEEEERAKEQKAKALAKLEELNRRSLAGESGNAKSENTSVLTQNQGEQVGSVTSRQSEMAGNKFAESSQQLVSNSDVHTSQHVEVVQHSSKMQQTYLSGSEEVHLPAYEDSLDAGAKKVALQSDDSGISTFKPTGLEQNQKVSVEKSLSDKSVPCVLPVAPKDLIRIGTIDITLSEGSLGEAREKELRAPSVSNALAQPAEQQRRKSNQSKNKNKLDDTLTQPISPVKNGRVSTENIEIRSSSPNFDTSVPTGVSAQEVSSLPSKESHSRVPNPRRTQPSRRMPRGQQSNRLTDKLHGNDNVTWAPVRTHDRKAEDLVETDKVPTEELANNTKGDGKSQNNSKGKRADMERYVMKAVVKELAQQGAMLPSTKSNESSVKEQPQPVKSENLHSAAGSVTETQDVDGGRHNKRKKEHEVRKQWIATDSSHTEAGHFKPGPAEHVEQSKEQNEPAKVENPLAPVRSSDGSYMSYGKYPPGKDQGMGRGKRHVPRGFRTIGNNHNQENISSGDIEGGGTSSASLDVHQTDKTIVSKENQNLTDRSHPHWKPKSSSKPASKSSGSESVATEVNQLAEKDHVEEGKSKVSQHDQEIDKTSDMQQVETVQQKALVGPGGDTEDQLEHNRSSGFMKNRSQNSRPFRGHEPRRDWSSSHDFRVPHNAPPHVFRERQRQNTHYEYQPVDPSKSNYKFRKSEDTPPERAENLNRRFQDSGPSQSKRGGGNFYKHQRGTARVDSAHD